MKFMKLGSKSDQFQNDGDTIRYVATDLETDMVVNVGDVKFYLHKFPLLSKSSHLQKLVANSCHETNNEIDIHDIPGGPAAFEICVKFCYGMVVTLNAYNVVAARCASEYLEMYETIEKGNLIYKIDIFLTSSLFRSWKDSIIVLQTTKSLLPWSEELKIVSHCLDSIATKASIDPSEVNWSYTYNRKKLPSENGNDPLWRKNQTVPKDWWVEDLCELQIDLYKRVITTIKAKESLANDVIGESLRAYSLRRLPGFSKGCIQGNDLMKYRYVVDTITWLLPNEKNCVPCGFLLKLLYVSIMLECSETGKKALMRIIALHLGEATVTDFMIRSSTGETGIYNIDIMHKLVELFVIQENSARNNVSEFPEICTGFTSDDSKIKVTRLIDSYLAEASRDSCLSLSSFVDLAEMVSSFPRSNHDGIYRAIDMFLKEHPGLAKSEKKRICRLMDCRKLSAEACGHAVQNERLPMRVVVQVLFFEQARANDNCTPNNISGSVKAALLQGGWSSRSATTNTDEDYDGDQITSQEFKDLKGELASLRLRKNACDTNDSKLIAEKVAAKKVKKIFSGIWSKNDRQGENSSSSDTSASNSAEEIRCTPSRSRRQS